MDIRTRLRRNVFRNTGASIGPDTIPDAFSFVDQTGVALSTVITSAPVTITGMNAAAVISIVGGSYNINGGSYTSSPSTVVSGDVVRARVTSSSTNSANANAVVTIGGVSDTFTATTVASADTTPDAFTFTDQTGVALSTAITSAPITVAGIDTASAITVSGGQYSINGGAFTSSAGTVVNGDVVRAKVNSSSSGLTAANCVVTIGGVSDTFTATTAAAVSSLATIQVWAGATLLDQTGDFGDATSRIGVNGNGWVAKATMPFQAAQVFNPSLVTFTVQDPGYDATGTPTTVTRTIVGRAVLRRQYNVASGQQFFDDGTTVTVWFSLSDDIYQGSTIVSVTTAAGFYGTGTAGTVASVTNSSTVAYPKVLGGWGGLQHERWTGATLVEFLAYHRHGMNGRMVARVEFTATDQHGNTSATQITSAPTLSTLITQGNKPEVYAATIPVTALTQGDLCLVNVRAYPWIGDSTAVLDLVVDGTNPTGALTTSQPQTPLRFTNDKSVTYGGGYIYVRAGAAGTPQVSRTAATAAANPYPTINAGLAAGVVFNNANSGHNDHSGCIIRLMDNGAGGAVAHTFTALGGNAAGLCLTVIEKDPAATGAVSVSIPTTRSVADKLHWKVNITQTSGAGLDGGTANGNIIQAFTDLTLNTANTGIPLNYRMGLTFLRNITSSGGGESPYRANFTNVRMQAVLIAGCIDTASGGVFGSVVAGNSFKQRPYQPYDATYTLADAHDGYIAVNNKLMDLRSPVIPTPDRAIVKGLVFSQNVVERSVVTTSPALQIAGDSSIWAVDNILDFHNTVVGERTNRMYADEAASAGVIKRISSRFNIWREHNCKTDTFIVKTTVTGRVGNWRYRHMVGCLGNVCIIGQQGGGGSPTNISNDPTNWLGEAWPAATFNAGAANVTFVNDQSLTGGNAGNGDYHLAHGGTDAAANQVPAGQAMLAFALDGTARPNNGTGSAGANQ